VASVVADPEVFTVTDSVPVQVAGEARGRKGLYLVNETGQNLYVLLGPGTVSSAFKSFIIGDLQTYEMVGDICHTGPVHALAASGGNGRVTVTELFG
jgi:hypothetical protein